MSHDDSSGGAGSPLITTPNTGRDGWASEQTESVLRVIPALLCNAPLFVGKISNNSSRERWAQWVGRQGTAASMGAGASRGSNKVVSAVADDMARSIGASSGSKASSKKYDERASTSVVGTLTEVQLEEFREAFDAFDKDGGGSIDKEELMELFQSLGQTPSSEELDRMVACADADGNETIDFFEVSRA